MAKENIVVNIGEGRLVVDPDKYSLAKVKKLTTCVSEIRTRYVDEMSKKLAKLDSESDEDYNIRLGKMGEENYLVNISYDILKVVANAFEQGDKVTEESFNSDKTSWPKVKAFLHSVLAEGDMAAANMFLPPRKPD